MTIDSVPPRDETLIREACARGSFDAAVALTLRQYGGEVFGFLCGILREYDPASDAFELLQERVWTTMSRFEWKCSMRTWVYRLARNAAADVRRGQARDKLRHVDFSSRAGSAELAAELRSETLSIFRTERRSALESLYETLSDEDRELVVLRAARSMPFREIAIVLAGGDAQSAGPTSKQECDRVRKRYQLVHDRLRQLGKERGLI